MLPMKRAQKVMESAVVKKGKVESIPVDPPNELVHESLPCLVTFPIVGDGRCFFRSVVQWQRDPLREGSYDASGCPVEKQMAREEQQMADDLRLRVVAFAMEHEFGEMAEHPGGPEGWANAMGQWNNWVDEVIVAATSAMLQQPILVLSWDPERQRMFFTIYLEEFKNKPVIPQFFNGVDHYELIDEQWLQDIFV